MKSAFFLTIVLFILTSIPALGQPIKEGEVVPDFQLVTDNGSTWRLADNFTSDYLVIYFYPAAMTGGCTTQACSYRDKLPEFEKKNTQVIAISGDKPEGLTIFKKAYNLNFPLLSDESGKVAGLLGVPMGKGGSIARTVDGKEVTLERNVTTSRWTFVLDKNRRLIKIVSDVKPAEDGNNILKFITEVK